MDYKAGDSCGCKKGIFIYSGDKKKGPNNSYQRIIECTSCKTRYTESKTYHE